MTTKTKAMTDDIEQLLTSLKLKQMQRVLDRELARAEKQGSSTREVLARLLREEYLHRREKSLEYRIKRVRRQQGIGEARECEMQGKFDGVQSCQAFLDGVTSRAGQDEGGGLGEK